MGRDLWELLPPNPAEGAGATFRHNTMTHNEPVLIAVIASRNNLMEQYNTLELRKSGGGRYGGRATSKQSNQLLQKHLLLQEAKAVSVEHVRSLLTASNKEFPAFDRYKEQIRLAKENYKKSSKDSNPPFAGLSSTALLPGKLIFIKRAIKY